MSTQTDELLQELLNTQGPLGLARMAGEHESAIQTTATAAVVIRPDTVSAITVWNGENHGGKSLVIDRIFTHNLVSTAVKDFFGMWYCLHLEMTKPTNDITTLRGTGDGREPNNSTVVVDVAATVLDDGWFPCGREGSISETGITPQGIAEWECNGRLVVPPNHGISVQVVSSLVGDTFTSGLSWWRTQL
ncbi:MAG: hypothetical protein HQ581_27645 [Planctomycetes bacterium]|nr:hypothetical protein [Planctomycetota bacterium]